MREQLKVVLIQFREDETERLIELNGVAKAAGLAPEQIKGVELHLTAPDQSLLDGCQTLAIGGAKYSVFEDFPHKDRLIALLQAARERRIPILGLCFGAQLIAQVFGGEVVRDSEHEEYGTFTVTGTDDAMFDIIFADAPDTFNVQCAHHDAVAKLPPSAVLLASSARCRHQAFMIPGADIYAFQFHPERTKADFETLIAKRMTDHGSTYAGVAATLQASPEASALLAKFIDRIVLQKR